MRRMALDAIYPSPKLSQPEQGHKVFPYLLRGVTIDRVDQVWSTDITYVPLPSVETAVSGVSVVPVRNCEAEREGFEPSVAFLPHRFSRPARSATPAPLLSDGILASLGIDEKQAFSESRSAV
jgi:hypothetical protein